MIRALGLRSAVAVNVCNMIGAGPFITIPLVVTALLGSISVWAWIAGALVACCDGLVYAELASLWPRSGGTYVYLREAFGAQRYGRLFAFLFCWQYLFWAPLVIASGYIGFAQYAGYLAPALRENTFAQGVLASLVGVFTLVALYRPIPTIARASLVLGSIALVTLAVVAVAGFAQHRIAIPALLSASVGAPPGIAAFGAALLITIYDYGGYNTACALGDEVHQPSRTIPRAVIASVAIVATLYIALNLGVFSSLSPHDAAGSTFVASTVVERIGGVRAAAIVTVMVLVTAFASTFALLLAAARVPYAAALDGNFLAPFARLHPTGRFPAVGLVVIGLLACAAAFFPLDQVIAALTAGIALVQGAAQVVALAVVRARRTVAPFRAPLYPLVPLVALAGWLYLFASAGRTAIVFGIVTLAGGALVYAVRAGVRREWPFAAVVTPFVVLIAAASACAPAAAAGFTASALVERDGVPQLVVGGKPFFLNGAAFFYERLPVTLWRASIVRLKEQLGINTLDLYIPWNWHELHDGDYDFDGHTNPRRNLHAVLALAHEYKMMVVLRPGPVIRNEWRNGGYPAWLLERPEYGMPQHDLLEGRYPPTATLQNAHSDDAAAEWLANGTHLRYSERWLRRVATEVHPWADRVIAWQIDDDQGAYIDNQTWPAPHLHAYLDRLAAIVRSATSPLLPLYINTYEMKVTASSPLWAMGNWYQSTAYSIGEHDRSSLEFSAGLLQTQPHRPLVMSEFQAGWLQGPGEVVPRRADATNTTLALHTLLQMGMHGIIHFPAQDTLYPAGWEVPFANWYYAWNAALQIDPNRFNPRAFAMLPFGIAVAGHDGEALAQSEPATDAAIAWLPSAIDPLKLTQDDVFALQARTQLAQQFCRGARLGCRLVDLRYISLAQLTRYPMLLLPAGGIATEHRQFTSAVVQLIQRYARAHPVFTDVALPGTSAGRVVPFDVPLNATRAAALANRLLAAPPKRSRVLDLPNASLLVGRGSSAYLDIVNYGRTLAVYRNVAVRIPRLGTYHLPAIEVDPRNATLIVFHPFAGDRAPRPIAWTSCPWSEAGHRVQLLPIFGSCATGFSDGVTVAISGAESAEIGPRDRRAIVRHGRLGMMTGPVREGPPSDSQIPLRGATDWFPAALPSPAAEARAVAHAADVFADGTSAIVLENDLVRVIVAPAAGGRAFVFEDKVRRRNVFTTIGAMRDDAFLQPPPSRTDRIAKYTNTFPVGLFNRPYSATIVDDPVDAVVRLRYRAPDVIPAGATFEKTLRLRPHSRSLELQLSASFDGSPESAARQRAVEIDSLLAGDPRTAGRATQFTVDVTAEECPTTLGAPLVNPVGLFDAQSGTLVAVSWPPGDVEDVRADRTGKSLIVRMRYGPGPRRTWFTIGAPHTLLEATQAMHALPRCKEAP